MSAIPRNDGEDFAEYKLRRAADHVATKASRTKLFHDSYYDGTYINPEKEAKREHKKAKRVQNTPHNKKTNQRIAYTA